MTKSKVVLVLLLALLVLTAMKWSNYKSKTAGEVKESIVVRAKEEWKKEVRSGDGKVKLRGTSRELASGQVEYVFRVIDAQGKEVSVYRKEVGADEAMDIPFNSWSPDNKQFFLEENDGQTVRYLVYREDGGKYGGERKYLNINEDWAKSKNNYVIDGVTGWEGNDLLRVTTNNGDGTNGPSFWFVVSSRKFLRLRG